MKGLISKCLITVISGGIMLSTIAGDKAATPNAAKPVAKTAVQPAKATPAPAAAQSAPKAKSDTIVVKARLLEIPGTFPPNELYDYVYIMKYKIIQVVKGSFSGQEILVGQYNPLKARKQVKDKMDANVDGDVEKFEVGAKHQLTLITPIEKVWKGAVEDEFIDEEGNKYFAVKTDLLK